MSYYFRYWRMSKSNNLVDGIITPSPKYKYFFALTTVFGVSLILFYINSQSNFNYKINISNYERRRLRYDDKAYTINTVGCTIPLIEPTTEELRHLIFKPNRSCLLSSPPIVNRINNLLLIDYNALESLQNITEPYCCAQKFFRPKSIEDIDSIYVDDRVKYESCDVFNHSYVINSEYVKVACFDGEVEFYRDFFISTPLKKNKKVKHKSNPNPYSVLIIGLDAMSRMNFHRTMPNTLNFLRERNVVEMKGYNKVADNTLVNVLPVLTGWSHPEATHNCHQNDKYTFNNCPFLWEFFQQEGFITAFGEDSPRIGTFNYVNSGFARQPTDYYMYTFMHQAEKHNGKKKDLNSYLCMGHRFFYQVMLDYIQNLTLTLTLNDQPYFGFFWEASMSHDYLNMPMLMDDSFVKFFEATEFNGVLNNTIVILMSDHGIRWGEFRNTKQGRLEERLPFVYFLLPETFKANYPSAYENLVKNTEKLTTPFDLHETIQDFLDLNTLNGTSIENRARELLPARGYSLFLPLPENRTCSDAGIADHWCTCHKSKTVNITDLKIIKAANVLVLHINKLLEEYTQCANLTLHHVLEASQFELSDSVVNKVTHHWTDYTLVISVLPSRGVFEATIRQTIKGDFVVTGTISRLNLYGSQSKCIDVQNLKLYCYC